MADIYELHAKAFARVSAYVITKDGDRKAVVAIKYPADGAGRLYAYVHWFGAEMVRGYASGGGYDKRTAACASAARRLDLMQVDASFVDALAADNGYDWTRQLERYGYTVWQAI